MTTKNLSLEVIKNVPGVLETNIDALEKFVDKRLESYTPELFDGDADAAKKARTELNTAKKQVSTARIALMKELMKPYSDFEDRCKGIERKIDEGSAKLDVIVKAREKQEKERKRAEIWQYWQTKKFDLVPFDRLFNEKWLNKTAKMSDIQADLDGRIEQIYKDIKTIESFVSEDTETLKAHYLDCLDIGDTLDYGEEMKKNKARLANEAKLRAEREHAERIQEQKKQVAEEQQNLVTKKKSVNLAADALEEEPPKPAVDEYVLSIRCTEVQLLGIKNFLTGQGIEFDPPRKIEF